MHTSGISINVHFWHFNKCMILAFQQMHDSSGSTVDKNVHPWQFCNKLQVPLEPRLYMQQLQHYQEILAIKQLLR